MPKGVEQFSGLPPGKQTLRGIYTSLMPKGVEQIESIDRRGTAINRIYTSLMPKGVEQRYWPLKPGEYRRDLYFSDAERR